MPIGHHLRVLAPAAVLVVATLLAAAPSARAHSPASAHGCTAPTRPADDRNDVLWQRFLDDVDAFRACVSSYAETNRRAAEIHSNAANDATLAWNRFVRAELNVPEDYPWPPQEPDVRSH